MTDRPVKGIREKYLGKDCILLNTYQELKEDGLRSGDRNWTKKITLPEEFLENFPNAHNEKNINEVVACIDSK